VPCRALPDDWQLPIHVQAETALTLAMSASGTAVREVTPYKKDGKQVRMLVSGWLPLPLQAKHVLSSAQGWLVWTEALGPHCSQRHHLFSIAAALESWYK